MDAAWWNLRSDDTPLHSGSKAFRASKRRISDAVYRQLLNDTNLR